MCGVLTVVVLRLMRSYVDEGKLRGRLRIGDAGVDVDLWMMANFGSWIVSRK
jgi:hypothetical protein